MVQKKNKIKMILVSGFPGSGKTTLGKVLQREMGISIIDADHIRERLMEKSTFLSKRPSKMGFFVNLLFLKELFPYILIKKKCFMIDRNVSSKKIVANLKRLKKNIFLIQILSNDIDNINRLCKREEKLLDDIKSSYQKIQKMHFNDLDLNDISYILPNLTTLDSYEEECKKLCLYLYTRNLLCNVCV